MNDNLISSFSVNFSENYWYKDSNDINWKLITTSSFVSFSFLIWRSMFHVFDADPFTKIVQIIIINLKRKVYLRTGKKHWNLTLEPLTNKLAICVCGYQKYNWNSID